MTRGSQSQADTQESLAAGEQVPAEAELLLMIKGPLVTQAEKSSSDPRWKRGHAGAGLKVAPHHSSRPPPPQNALDPQAG